MEELALSDKQSTEVASAEVAFVYWCDERLPQFVTHIFETAKIPSTTLSKRVPDCGTKAWPKPVFVFCVGLVVIIHIFGEVVFENVERLFREDPDALVPGI